MSTSNIYCQCRRTIYSLCTLLRSILIIYCSAPKYRIWHYNCRFTRCRVSSNTSYKFYDECCTEPENIYVVGEYPSNKIEKVLTCYPDVDKWTEFYLPEIVDIPETPFRKPDIESIVEIHSCIEIISQRVVKTPIVTGYTGTDGIFIPGEQIGNSECTHLTGRKLIIEGLLKQKMQYKP